MPRLEAPVVISANCLLTGAVMYWGPESHWCANLSEAKVYEDLGVAADVVSAVADPAVVIGLELVPVKVSGNIIQARHYREAIRASGPGSCVLPSKTGGAHVSV